MSFSTLPVAYAGPEGPGGQTTPGPSQPGVLASTRKRAINNATFQMHPTNVCQLPNQALTTGAAVPANSAIIICEAANGTITPGTVLVRMWMDGTAPTTITGLPIYAGVPYEIIGQDDLANVRFVSADANQHVLQVQYFSGI